MDPVPFSKNVERLRDYLFEATNMWSVHSRRLSKSEAQPTHVCALALTRARTRTHAHARAQVRLLSDQLVSGRGIGV